MGYYRIKSLEPMHNNLGRSGLSQEFTDRENEDANRRISCFHCNIVDSKNEKVLFKHASLVLP